MGAILFLLLVRALPPDAELGPWRLFLSSTFQFLQGCSRTTLAHKKKPSCAAAVERAVQMNADSRHPLLDIDTLVLLRA